MGLSLLEAKLDKKISADSIVTIGEGGCGFVATELHKEAIPPRRVFCSFRIEGAPPIEIQGNLIYVQEVPLNAKKTYFLGVEFIEAHRHLIKPVIEEVEKLASQGLVKQA